MPESGTPSLSPESQPSVDSYPSPGYLYPYSAPGQYPGYPPPGAPPALRNGAGIAALIVAIAGIVTALSVIGGVALGLVAMVLGIIGRGRAKRGEADNGGVALAGIVLGALAVVAGIGCIFIYVGIWRTAGGGDYVACMTKAGSNTAAQQQCTERFKEHFENTFGSGADAPMVQEESDTGLMPA
ncbi:DUF4190 domain-containing protein [Mycolicibacter hiberniae]|uniref:Uncharacterized protein n=1 Tax=Mycolicibacter hiberniae TaxID=29314 RepID=A0A7I7X2Q6_9MYCO|nr:DUF4190 domain-containing protein [Mycolicibacter hiberniae]MCV7085262.1 DUF4190 domain-containing protein [Mycolicibacter hiberniae]ORV70391.1 hypothetical protein AWC09_10540 [Mycolicibacter hiberniae]BBZ23167.1 hypothetical protein MHIB_15850 [Mycolicibacter hiberniae]